MSCNFVKKACVFASISSACIKSRTTATPAMPVPIIWSMFSEVKPPIATTGMATVWQIVFKVDIRVMGAFPWWLSEKWLLSPSNLHLISPLPELFLLF